VLPPACGRCREGQDRGIASCRAAGVGEGGVLAERVIDVGHNGQELRAFHRSVPDGAVSEQDSGSYLAARP